MTLMLGGAAHAQSKTDIEYDRAIKKISQMDRVKIDTVIVNADYESEAAYNPRTDMILLHYLLEKSDTNVSIARSKKYIRNTLAHEMEHREKEKIYKRTLFQNTSQKILFNFQNELAARIAEILEFRKQLQESKKQYGTLVLTDDFGQPLTHLPPEFSVPVPRNLLFKCGFNDFHILHPYYLYLNYVIYTAEILDSDNIKAEEADYILATAIAWMNNHLDEYTKDFAKLKFSDRPFLTSLGLIRAELTSYPDTDLDCPLTPDFKKKYSMVLNDIFGVDGSDVTTTYRQIQDNLDDKIIATLKNGLSVDQATEKIFTISGINFLKKFSSRTKTALNKYLDIYMFEVNHYIKRNEKLSMQFNLTNFCDEMIFMQANHILKHSHKQKLHAATDKVQNKSKDAASSRTMVHPAGREMD